MEKIYTGISKNLIKNFGIYIFINYFEKHILNLAFGWREHTLIKYGVVLFGALREIDYDLFLYLKEGLKIPVEKIYCVEREEDTEFERKIKLLPYYDKIKLSKEIPDFEGKVPPLIALGFCPIYRVGNATSEKEIHNNVFKKIIFIFAVIYNTNGTYEYKIIHNSPVEGKFLKLL